MSISSQGRELARKSILFTGVLCLLTFARLVLRLLALQYAEFHLDPNDISKENDALAEKNSRCRPFFSYSLSKSDLKEVVKSMISKKIAGTRRRPEDIRVARRPNNLENSQV